MTLIERRSQDEISNIIIDTLNKGKQAIVFVNTKRSAESCADKITTFANKWLANNKELSEEVLKALPSPTKQCRRLSKNVNRGVAFHHSGLNSKQRTLIEENFLKGNIKVVCATPTLAAGIDLPAFRVIIRDLKRYTGFGMSSIPVLEYEQMSGRAGRPSYDNEGEAIIIAKNIEEREQFWYAYVEGEPEDILSKLAVEPVLRTYILSLVSTGYVGSMEELMKFMSETFYAQQYSDLSQLRNQMDKIIYSLEEWEFVRTSRGEFQSFNEDYMIKTTKLGDRVSELYLDPLTAHELLEGMRKVENFSTFSFLQLISQTLEMRPYFRVKQKEIEEIEAKLLEVYDELYVETPSEFSDEYDDFLNIIKTAVVLEEWMNEVSEDYMYEQQGITPGELHMKLDRGDWLLYSCCELSKLEGLKEINRESNKLRVRLSHGVKEELLPLIKFKGIGRVRARKLFKNNIKDAGDVKKASWTTLTQLLGDKTAVNLKEQVGEKKKEESNKGLNYFNK